MTRIMRPIAAALLALGATLAHADDASDWRFGSFDEGGWSWMMQPPTRSPIAERDVLRYAEWLGLTDSQRDSVDDLTQALTEQCLAAWVHFSEARSDAQAAAAIDNDWAAMQARLRELGDDHDAERKRHIDAFFADVRLFLTPEQEEAWPRIERQRRRALTLIQHASVEGEALDLIAIVDALSLDEPDLGPIRPLLADYEVRLDAALQARNRRVEALGAKAARLAAREHEMWKSGKRHAKDDLIAFNAEREETRLECVADAMDVLDAARRIADVNREYIALVTPLIPDDRREDWDASLDAPVRGSIYDFGKDVQLNRAIRVINSLEEMEQTISMVETQTRRWAGDGSPLDDWVVFARSVRPISREQRDQLERIREDLEIEIERLAPESSGSDDEASRRHIPTPDGTLMIVRAGAMADGKGFNPWEGDQSAEAIERRRKLAEANTRALERIRRVLTMKQRALAAQMY
jgi:hypothetical protein